MNWPERWCSRWSEKQTIKLDFIYNLRFRALLVSRRVTSWEERSLTQVGLQSSALNWRSVAFPTWTWLESGGRGWRAMPGATRRSARKCSGWLQLEAQGHRLRDLDQAVVHLGSGCHVAIIIFFLLDRPVSSTGYFCSIWYVFLLCEIQKAIHHKLLAFEPRQCLRLMW